MDEPLENEGGDTDLEFENNVRHFLPPPFDPHVATVHIRGISNNPVDGFDVELTAAFGSEQIVITTEDGEIEATIAIYQGEVEITPFGCKIEHYYNGKEFENAGQTVSEIITIDKTQSRSSENQVTGKLGLNASLSTHSIDAAAGISAEAKRADETEVKSAIEIRREIGSLSLIHI